MIPRFLKCLHASFALYLLGVPAAGVSGAQSEISRLSAGFENPPAVARPGVYWYFMDGNVSKEGMTRDLEAMKAAGLGKVLFLEVNVGVPRGPVPFFSEEWKKAFVHAVKESERLGIEMTLGVGPGWTGSGGPWVKPEQSMKHVVGSRVNVEGPGQFSGKLPLPPPVKPYFGLPDSLKTAWDGYHRDVAVLAYPTPSKPSAAPADLAEKALYMREPFSSKPGVRPYLPEPPAAVAGAAAGVSPDSILDLTNRLRPDGSLDWQVPQGKWTILRLVARNNGMSTRPAPEPGVGFECDKFDPKALDDHLNNYVMALKERCGPSLPGRGWTMLHMDSWEMGAQNWSRVLQSEFKRRRGYDPLKWYPALTGEVIGDLALTERFLWDFRQTCAELIVDNHAGRLKERGVEKGMGLSIQPYDMHPGNDFDLAAVADVPMGEFWSAGHGFNTAFSCLQSVSVGAITGRPIVAAEAFTADGSEAWTLHPGNIKNQGDWAMAAGINRFFFHTFAHKPDESRPGMVMGPYGVHWDRGQTWWPMVESYHRYLSRCHFLLSQGQRVADILYLMPEGAPTIYQPPKSAFAGEPAMPDALGHAVDGCSASALIRLAKVSDGCVSFPGGARYKVLVLPNRDTMTPELLKKIISLVNDGATVVGRPPSRSPSLSGYPQCDEMVKRLAGGAWGPPGDSKLRMKRKLGLGQFMWGGEFDRPNADSLLAKATWIWHPTGNPSVSYPIGSVFFRCEVKSANRDHPIAARLVITADNTYQVSFNGKRIGSGNDYRNWNEYDLTELLAVEVGNELIVKADNVEMPGPAGLLAAVELTYADGTCEVITSGSDWQALYAGGGADWPNSRTEGWMPAMDLGAARMAPWRLALRPDKELYPSYQDVASLLGDSGLSDDFTSGGGVRHVHRRTPMADIYFLSNRTNARVVTTGSFRIAGGHPEVWDPLDGTCRILPDCKTSGSRTVIPLEFDPYGSYFVVFPAANHGTSTRATGNFPRFENAAVLDGGWKVAFDPALGGPGQVEFSSLADWKDDARDSIRHYSGVARYSMRFDLPNSASLPKDVGWFLNLGRVEVVARVRVNGEDKGVVWTHPYRVALGTNLKPVGNILEIEIANLWPNRMIGDASGTESRVSQSTYRPYKAKDRLLPSGLLGPVILQYKRD